MLELVAAFLLSVSLPAFAQEEANADVDQEITNPRMRAETGGKAKVSFQSDFTYSGGPLSDPFGKDRPRLSPGQIEVDPVKIAGKISGKYRATDYDNLNIGTGVSWLTPAYTGQRMQVENPYFSYSRPFRADRWEHVFAAQVHYYSSYNSRTNFKLNYGIAISHNLVTRIGDSGWMLGTGMFFTRQFYRESRPDGNFDGMGVTPFVEYWFSDRMSWRTMYSGLAIFNTNGARDTYKQDEPTQTLGFGFVITRDLYLFPNLQWAWNEIQFEKTTFALTANINL